MAKGKIPINVDVDTYNTISEMAAKENIARVKLVADHFAGRREATLNKQMEEKCADFQKELANLKKELTKLQIENNRLKAEAEQWQHEAIKKL